MRRLRLVVRYEDGSIYADFNPTDFRKMLVEEFWRTDDVQRAFDHVVIQLQKKTLRSPEY